jgi:shikimate kinase
LNVKPTQKVVLVGHRAAGKTTLLPLLAQWMGRPGIDLDAEISARYDRPLREWVAQDEAGFRRAERATFEELPNAAVIAAGGGFLSSHGAALAGHLAVFVPISRETYRERLLADATRPRLRPDLSLPEEIERVYSERELEHAKVPSISLATFLRATEPMH